MPENDPNSEYLQNLRDEISQLDAGLVDLLNRRARLAMDVGKLKDADGQPIYAPHRERKVMERVHGLNEGPLPAAALEAIYREIISASIALEQPLQVAYLGPAGSFSHLAARAHFGSSVEYVAADDIGHVFEQVDRGRCQVGLVPIENSIGGGIHDTLDSFVQSGVSVCAEVCIAIHHHLMSHADPDDIRCIYSRPEIFEQCRRWLGAHLTHAERATVVSSARAADLVGDQRDAAAIGSSLAAEIYRVPVRFENIEDNPQNVTRFFVIGKIDTQPTGADKTAIMFTTAHKPGALADVLDVFSRHGINLTHIDKRPSQRVNWEYYFFIDCEGHIDQADVKAALDEAREHCLHLTILGSFPKSTQVLG